MKLNSKHLIQFVLTMAIIQGFTFLEPRLLKTKDGTKPGSIFHESDSIPPQFIGGNKALYQFISDNVSYPAKALRKNHSGTSTIQFVIQKDSTVANLDVQKSSGYAELDKEALRIIKLTDKHWIPSSINGQSVKCIARQSIIFELEE